MNETSNTSDKSTYSSIRFFVSNQMLMAEFSPNSLKTAVDDGTIIQLLADSGFGKHQLEEKVLLNLTDNSTNNHQGDISLQQHTDAAFELKINQDQMSASVIIEQAHGGEDLHYDDVLESIKEAGIQTDYLDTLLLAKSLTSEQAEPMVIATGIPPVNGEDSKFKVLFNTETATAPKLTGDGSIDHYETHAYISVQEEQPVMRRIPHTAGIPGSNILGEKVVAENGKVIKFTQDNTVKIDQTEPNLLLAAKKGHPIASNDGVHIDDTLKVKNASLSTGNIHFDGSVEITGEVLPHVVVEASGDIFVHGVVENATLIAGNNITIGAGILSSKLFDHKDDSDFTPECTLNAKGTIIAKYCNSICASAKKDILIETYSMHSQLTAGHSLVFGHNNGKGAVIGGINYAKYGISANFMGSDAYVKTTVTCGPLSVIKKLNKTALSEISRSRKELSLLETVMNKVKSRGSPTTLGTVVLKKAKKLYDEINHVKRNITELEAKSSTINDELNHCQDAKIQINKKLYPNVHITINDINIVNNRERESSKISCDDYQIHFN